MTTLVVVPWRDGDKWRKQSFDFVTAHLDSCGQKWVPVDADPDKPFSRSATKNRGARWAEAEGADVVIFHDADMIVPCEA